ncbi:helix-turn-helix transcriptional regulator [Streptomyces sp. G6]|uniref:helix-turn-helix transcriptional regulator n=1 Tax=Streptomyces sp. G6 TaxID=1178736 RepID=UPI003EDB4A5F
MSPNRREERPVLSSCRDSPRGQLDDRERAPLRHHCDGPTGRPRPPGRCCQSAAPAGYSPCSAVGNCVPSGPPIISALSAMPESITAGSASSASPVSLGYVLVLQPPTDAPYLKNPVRPTRPFSGISSCHRPTHDRSRPMPEPRAASQTAFLTLPRAAEYLGISPNTLYVWRHRRHGPPSFRMGRRVMYRITALDEWVRDQERADSRSNRALDPLNRKPQRRSKAVK